VNARHIKAWGRVHRWSSVACTAFLLVLCLTGLPLIFHDEIDGLVEKKVSAPPQEGKAEAVPLGRIAEAGATRASFRNTYSGRRMSTISFTWASPPCQIRRPGKFTASSSTPGPHKS
jgi:hypothetical protein